ncbi:MAG: flagellar biosynthesis protein FlgD [Pirellulaceae bacterium]|jgi:flagellar basal-body rod modification protein FlgD|nr:flagellar biosynthesis protein FlgD [Pirellulaceae bacterium]
MSRINTTFPGATPTDTANKPKSLEDLNVDEFLKLMITELTNQDPLNPMDNAQLVEQIGQIRNLSATSKLTDTLDTVVTGQSLSTASSLIGKEVNALNDRNENVTGKVERVSVEVDPDNPAKRTFRVHIGDSKIDLKNVREIHP